MRKPDIRPQLRLPQGVSSCTVRKAPLCSVLCCQQKLPLREAMIQLKSFEKFLESAAIPDTFTQSPRSIRRRIVTPTSPHHLHPDCRLCAASCWSFFGSSKLFPPIKEMANWNKGEVKVLYPEYLKIMSERGGGWGGRQKFYPALSEIYPSLPLIGNFAYDHPNVLPSC